MIRFLAILALLFVTFGSEGSLQRGLDLSGSMQGAGGIGGLLARTDHSTFNPQPSTSFYHSDGNGNISTLTDSSGTVVARYLYDPFGRVLGKWGPMADVNRYRFSSKETDNLTGLSYYGYRFYDPNLQRWLNEDPIRESGGNNLYCFAANYAINGIDPFGLSLPAYDSVDANPEIALDPDVFGAMPNAPKPLPVPLPLPPTGASNCEMKSDPPDLDYCVKTCKESLDAKRLDRVGYRECVRKCMRSFPPKDKRYKAPKKGPKKTSKGWEDKSGDVWEPATHDGTHRPHYDVQHRNGTHTPIYPEGLD